MNPRIVGLFLAAVLIIAAAGTGLASGGSAYVTSDCNYPSLQDNSIGDGDTVYVWIKPTGGNQTVGQWSTVDNSGANAQDGDLDYASCVRYDSKGNVKYFLYEADGFDSSVIGSYTLTAWQGDAYVSTPISGDGFKVVND